MCALVTGVQTCALPISGARIDLAASVVDADQMFSALETKLPTQTNRSNEQIEWQQFATLPRFAWRAARACAFVTDELMLEPSAGTGMLAIWAAKADARLALNEISPLRRDCLNALFPAARVTGHNAELIDELLDPAIIPSVVLMNPPYSHGIERGHDRSEEHTSALQSLMRISYAVLLLKQKNQNNRQISKGKKEEKNS